MAVNSVTAPFFAFANAAGQPLEAGFIYIGQPGLEAQSSPKASFFDVGLTIPTGTSTGAAVRTSGGYPVRNGSAATIYVDGDYSMTVKDRNGVLIFSRLNRALQLGTETTNEPYVILIMGQSNAVGVNSGGPNPASSLVTTWDAVSGSWGSSSYSALPWTRATPDGNGGNNNYALGRAHRIAADTGRQVYIVYDAASGISIDQWVAAGTASVRYAAAKTKVQAALATLTGKTVIDEIIWAQGEEDFKDPFAEHLGNLTLLRNQLRAETWCDWDTPIYMCGPSNLHDRYMWQNAMQYFCASVDNRSIFVPSNGLRTVYQADGVTNVPGAGDFTHFLGESVWEMGYRRIADARPVEAPANLYFNRGNGPANGADTQVIATWDSLFSFASRTGGAGLKETFNGTGAQTIFPLDYRGTAISEVTVGGVVKVSPTDWTLSGTNDSVAGLIITFVVAPPAGTGNVVISYAFAPNAPGATGSVGFGYANFPDGNWTYTIGYQNWSANTCNYSLIGGRENGAAAAADYSFAWGFQHLLSAQYTFAAGRGHIPSDDGGAAVGLFSEYRTGQADDVLFQVGRGTSGTPANAFAARASGILEAKALPTYADNAAAVTGGLTLGQMYKTATGELRIRV